LNSKYAPEHNAGNEARFFRQCRLEFFFDHLWFAGAMSSQGLILTLQTASAAVLSVFQTVGRAVGLGEQQVVHLLQLLQYTMRLMVPPPSHQGCSSSLWQHLVACRDRDRVLQVLVVCAERVVPGDSSGSECLRERVWLVTALNRHALAKALEVAFPAGYADALRQGVASAVAALDCVAFNIAFSHSSHEQLAFAEFEPQTAAAEPRAVVTASATTAKVLFVLRAAQLSAAALRHSSL
jgi:hypothetical protein